MTPMAALHYHANDHRPVAGLSQADRQILIELRDAAKRFWKAHDRHKPTPMQVVEETFRWALAVTEDVERPLTCGIRSLALVGGSSMPIYTSAEVTRAHTVRDRFEGLLTDRDRDRERRNWKLRRNVLIRCAMGHSHEKVAREFEITVAKVNEYKEGCLQEIAGKLRDIIEATPGVKTGKRKASRAVLSVAGGAIAQKCKTM